MSYEITYSKQAAKVLAKMPKNTARLIRSKVEAVAADPAGHHNNVTALQGSTSFRLRVGDYRVIYSLDNGQLTMLVIKIGSRGGVYQ